MVVLIVAFAIMVLILALFGGIDSIVDLVRRRKGKTADTEVIADSRDQPDS